MNQNKNESIRRKVYTKLLLLVVFGGLLLWMLSPHSPFSDTAVLEESSPKESEEQKVATEESQKRFTQFTTDETKHSVPLEDILPGGPDRDGIPPIDAPVFETASENKTADDVQGILVSINGDTRFYPYTIMVWHEIVNDVVGDTPIAVTFCPLCGSAIVFDRRVDGRVLDFGTSGFLFESNLVMYDRQTESFWSQARGQAIVGEMTDTQLEYIPMQLVTMADVRTTFTDAKILSEDTGHARNYKRYPYGDYNNTDELYFPISSTDTRFSPKEIFFVIPRGGVWYAVQQASLVGVEEKTFTLQDGTELTYKQTENGLQPFIDDEIVPSYVEMWFSFATQHKDSGVVLE